MLFDYFSHGINIGGYLSQYEIVVDTSSESALQHHFETFITEENIAQIASWGLDHVRIPVDGFLFFDEKTKFLREEPLGYLERCLEWCAKYGVNAVIDLHNIEGHRYGAMDTPTPLMTDANLREDFTLFWIRMAEHFKGYEKIKVLFELFNEIADASGYLWNSLYKKAIEEIRKVDETRWVLVGTNYVNSVGYLDRLDLVDDPYVFYNFHYYEPNVFTHQKAHFSEEFCTYQAELTYPGDMSDYIEFLKGHEKFRKEHPLMNSETTYNDKKLMETLLVDAEKFMKYSGCELYCGEFGVIDMASTEEAVKWLRDFITICNQLKIGHAMWNYKCLDFEILDIHNQVTRPEILALLQEMK